MKKYLLVFLIFSLSLICYAEQKDLSDFNGYDWLSFTADGKISFVMGFISGSGYVATSNSQEPFYCFLYSSTEYDEKKAYKIWDLYSDPKNIKKISFSHLDVSSMLDLRISWLNETLKTYNIVEISVGQIRDGLNQLYSDFKNKQILLSSAIHVVKKQIKGASSEEIEAILQWLRDDKKDFNKRTYINKEGKKITFDFP